MASGQIARSLWGRYVLTASNWGWVVGVILLFLAVSAPAKVLHLEDLKLTSQNESGPLLYDHQTLTGWVYQLGDDPLWASPNFDDSNWQTLPPPTDDPWHLPKEIDWQGVGWFRLHMRLHRELKDHALAMLLYQSGAIEVYINGDLIHQNGTITNGRIAALGRLMLADLPDVIPLDVAVDHDLVVAVRYAHENTEKKRFLGLPTWWGVGLATVQNAYIQRDQRIRQRSLMQMLAGVPLTFALLHFLFYLFHPRARGNLYYAIFAGWTAVLIFIPMYFPFQTKYLPLLFGFLKVGLIGAILAGFKFYYYEFFNRMPRYWSFIVWPSFVLLMVSWMLPLKLVFLIAVLGFPELMRIVIKAIRQKRPGAWLVGVGLSVFVLTCTYQVFIELDILRRTASYLYIYGILCLVVSMSVYLAYTFGAAGKDLESQVLEVQRLSEQNIKQSQIAREQERQKREREIAHKVLASENKLRTLELEETQKRQQILDDLWESNQNLHHTQAQLVQAEKMASLGNLVAGIAHEINTPVGAINSMHDTLVRAVAKLERELERKLPQDHPSRRVVASTFQVIGEANRVIAMGTERVRDIVRSLRNFARLDEADWKRVNIHDGIESTLALVQHDIKNRIELIKAYGDIPMVECFPGRLNQVFLNLLVNAGQAIEGTGSITIRTKQEEDNVLISIEDTGKGIAPENLTRIFDSGFTTKKVGLGTGLGLSICSQIVEAHQGEIKVESRVGEGTTFTVVLPIVQKKEEAAL